MADLVNQNKLLTAEECHLFIPRGRSVWLGLVVRDGQWVWEDGSPITYSNWDQGEPRQHRTCAYLSTVLGDEKWRTSPCEDRRIGLCTIRTFLTGFNFVLFQ